MAPSWRRCRPPGSGGRRPQPRTGLRKSSTALTHPGELSTLIPLKEQRSDNRPQRSVRNTKRVGEKPRILFTQKTAQLPRSFRAMTGGQQRHVPPHRQDGAAQGASPGLQLLLLLIFLLKSHLPIYDEAASEVNCPLVYRPLEWKFSKVVSTNPPPKKFKDI